MAEIAPEIVDALMHRADDLMTNAPGRVKVRRISQIDEVQALRQARATLSTDEEQALAKLRYAMIERLQGALSNEIPVTGAPKGIFAYLLYTAAKNVSQVMGPQGGRDYLVEQAGAHAVDGAPFELLDAAEAWALSHMVADRVDVDLTMLRREWDQAEINPVE